MNRVEAMCERLTAVESSQSDGGEFGWKDRVTTNWYRNPDGPDAAALLRDQAEEIDRLRGALERLSIPEAFDTPKMISGPLAEEMRMRMVFAEQALTQKGTT